MITIMALASYVVHVFLCRWIIKKAYQLNNDEYVKGFTAFSFIVFLGLIVSLMVFFDEYENKNSNKDTWFKGKNW
jgi:hypothetical protein